jgi:hypothetical protein
MEFMTKAGNVLERMKTPLALAGLVVLVLYGIYYEIFTWTYSPMWAQNTHSR